MCCTSSLFGVLTTFFLHAVSVALSDSPSLSSCLSVQLIDLSEVFLSTEVEFLRSALSHPGGSVQAICVPSGAVRREMLSPMAANSLGVIGRHDY